jgi:hypothetical protein
MARVTFTIDEDTARELERYENGLLKLRGRLRKAMEDAPEAQGVFFGPILDWLDQLEEPPSQSALVREAVGLYLRALREAERSGELDAGYRALAEDEERGAMIDALRAPARWNDEP